MINLNKCTRIDIIKALEKEMEELRKEQRQARAKLEPIYWYHTVITERGIRIIGVLQNKNEFEAHMKKYGSVLNMPDEIRTGIEYVLTIDHQLVEIGGGWMQPQIREEMKITIEEWNDLKRSIYPERLSRQAVHNI